MELDYIWAEVVLFLLLFFYFAFCFEHYFHYEPEESFWRKYLLKPACFHEQFWLTDKEKRIKKSQS